MNHPFSAWEAPFREPDRRYAVYQIIHGGAQDVSRVDFFDRRWFAGIVGNIAYDRTFPENENAWNAMERGIRTYLSRGMHAWLYDENGYPSGTAGGYVTEHHPELVAKGLYCYDYWRQIGGPSVYRADVPGDRLWKALLLPVDGGEPIDVTHCLNENNVLYIDVPAGRYYLFMMSIRRLFDGTHATESYSEPRNYVSLSDPRATEQFLSCTHENYRKHLSDEFGRGVLAMFTDEPSLISWNIRAGVFPILPWLETYPADFEKKYGYPFWLACAAVVTGRGNTPVRRRCDFWEFVADTVADSYFGKIQDWCRKNNLKSSGHMLEEERLQAHVYNYGSFYRSMKRFDWPGIDQLNTEPAALMSEHCIPIARFIASFADINGEHEVFTEFSDHCVRERGEKASRDCYYASVNWHLAMGVNNFTSYYSWETFDDESTAAFNRYTARSGWLLRRGCRDSRAAVFYPEAAMWDSYTPSTKVRAVDDSDRTRRLDAAFVKTSWELLHRQIDFDYIDCDLLLKGEVRNGALCYRDRSYYAVLLPCARVLEDRAAEKLLALAKAGIAVFFCEEAPVTSRESGAESPYADAIRKALSDGLMHLAPTAEFGAMLDETLPAVCRPVTLSPFSPMLLSHQRVTEDGSRIVYIADMDQEAYSGTLSVAGSYSDVWEADAFTGEMHPADFRKEQDSVSLSVSVRSGEGRFFLLK